MRKVLALVSISVLLMVVGFMALSTPTIGLDHEDGASVFSLADVSVDVAPDVALAANPFDCIAARVFRFFTPFLSGYWNFIIGRVCTMHYDPGQAFDTAPLRI